jgi:O-methyltransferase involved in polyketide biosynthesis
MSNPVEENSVQDTMFLPLWSRETYSKFYPINGNKAKQVLDQMISDFGYDINWMDKIPYSKEKGIFFIAGRFFLYFTTDQVKSIITTLVERFTGGELIFVGSTKLGVKMTNRKIKKIGKSEMLWKFALQRNIQKQFESWSVKINLKDTYSYWERTTINPHWKELTKKVIKIAEKLKMGKFVHLNFI